MKPRLTMTQRVLLAIVVLLLDSAVFFFPITAVFLAYVIIYNPPWFRDFMARLEPPGAP